TVTVRILLTATGTLVETATVSSPTADPVPSNNTASVATTVAADLSLSKTASPVTVQIGQNITYQLTVTNNGPATPANVMVADPLPAGVQLLGATPSQGACSGTTAISCALGNLATGSTATVNVTVRVLETATDTIVNTATVKSDSPDPVPSNNAA